MVRTRLAIASLKVRISAAEANKKKVLNYVSQVEKKYKNRLITHDEYSSIIRGEYEGKKISAWVHYYNSYIKECKRLIRVEIKKSIKKRTSIFASILLSAFLLILIFSQSSQIQPGLTGLVIENQTQGLNDSLGMPLNISNSEVNTTGVPKEDSSPSLEPLIPSVKNVSNEIINKSVNNTQIPSNSEVNTTGVPKEDSSPSLGPSSSSGKIKTSSESVVEGQVVLGQVVKWKKNVILEKAGKVKIRVPEEAKNISVNKVKEKKPAKFGITGNVISEGEDSIFIRFFKNIFRALTGRVIENPKTEQLVEIDDVAAEYDIVYETPAPYSVEKEKENGKTVKIVGPKNIHYKNVLSFTNISESMNIRDPSRLKIRWVEEGININIKSIKDKNSNGIYDYIEWITPHLSNQTFEIIVITDAEHLDSNRDIIKNIYDKVNETDGVAYTIPEGEYVRAYFENNLTNKNVIDIFTLDNGYNSKIEVYLKDSTTLVGEIYNVTKGAYYIDLGSMVGQNYIFDLKSVGGDVLYDYIHDAAPARIDDVSITPPSSTSYLNDTSFWVNVTYANAKNNNYACTLGLHSGADISVGVDDATVGIGLTPNVDGGCEVVSLDTSGCSGMGCSDNSDGRVSVSGSGTFSSQVVKFKVQCHTPGNWDVSSDALVGWTECSTGQTTNLNLYIENLTITEAAPLDTSSPTYSQNQVNNTIAGSSTEFSLLVDDNTILNPNGQYIFSTNNTGVWVNDSAVNFTTTPEWSNITKTLNSTVGVIVGYRWYISDSSGNTNSTGIYTLSVTVPDVSAPVLTDFKFYALNSSGGLIGNETEFTGANLAAIEYMNITFTLTDASGISGDPTIFYTAKGNGGCATGNLQSSECYNDTNGNWIEFQNGTTTPTFKDEGALGDYISCSYIGSSTQRNYTCMLDEHYNPNIAKWYEAGYNFSAVKWQNAANQKITNGNIIKINISSNIPIDADIYKLDFRVNMSSTVPNQALDVYACNSTYVTGLAESNSNCAFVASKTASEIQNNNGKFRSLITPSLISSINKIKYILLESKDSAASRYYSLKTYNATNLSHSIKWEYSIDSGVSYTPNTDGYETELNINWFYNTNPTGISFKVFSSDGTNSINSTPQNMTWNIVSGLNIAPLLTIINPNNGDNVSGITNINWTAIDPNSDILITNVSVNNGTNYLLLSNTQLSTYAWDTTLFSNGNYNLTVQTCENETSDLFCKNEIYSINVDNTPAMVINSLVLNSTNSMNLTNENLTIYINSTGSNIDITDWRLNDSSIALLNMPFEGGSNGTFTKDYSSYGKDGVVNGATWLSTGGHDGNGAYNFDNSNYITINGSNTLSEFGDEITMSVWTKPASSNLDATWHSLIMKQSTGYIEIFNDKFLTKMYPDTGGVSSDNTIVADEWYNVVVTYDRVSIKMYVNGVKQIDELSKTSAIVGSADDFYLGSWIATSDWFNGTIDDVMVLNHSLSAEQINSMYNDGLANHSMTTLVSQETNSGDNYTVMVTPNDGSSDGTSVLSNWLNVLNGNFVPIIFNVYNNTMTDISSGPNEGPLPTYVSINFSASDVDGYTDLNDSTALINFSKSGEASRTAYCSRIISESSGNFANYTCNVTMWWFDSAGTWNITASISDTNTNSATNGTQQFAVGSTTGFTVSPAALTWTSFAPSATLQEPNEYMTLNNTGNSVQSIQINATNLYGESDNSKALYATNFSAKISAGCGGTQLVDSTFTAVASASLPIGNYTIGDTTAQEDIYYCLEATNSDLSAQSYSTNQAGSWVIRIFMVFISAVGRKKKKKKKISKDDAMFEAAQLIVVDLKKEYSENKKSALDLLITELTNKYKISKKEILLHLRPIEKDERIPINIFTKELGALESLTKYFKENLGMNYKEISEILGRDERTVWSSYKKAKEKHKESFDIGEIEIQVPINIFNNRGFTVLENIIIYLKESGMKYVDIGRILSRDQRNIWSIYSKIKNE